MEDKFPGYIRDVDLQRTTMANGGWSKWKQGISHLENHASSAVHKAATMAFLAHHKKQCISQIVHAKNAQELPRNRIGLDAVLDTVMFMAQQGLTLRGHTNDESNLYQLLQTLGRQNETVKKFANASKNWSSPDIQNEMLEMVHHKIKEAVLPRIRKAGMFSIIADETMDASIQEQMSIVIRFFDIDELEVFEEFLGFYNVFNN